MVEFNIKSKVLSTTVEIIFILSLILMIIFPKKQKEYTCTRYNSVVTKDDIKCKTCGELLKDMTSKEDVTKDKYSLTAVLQNKEGTLMLNSNTIEKSYILTRIQGHELSIESFRTDKPNIKINDKGCVIE